MNQGYRIYCRFCQAIFRMAHPFLPYREPRILRGVKEIPSVLREKEIGCVLIVTGPNLHRLGRVDRLKETLRENGIDFAVYDQTESNPTVGNVEDACATYREHGCQGLIGFGGGSPMDCAKAVGAKLVRPNKPIAKMRGVLKIRKRIPFLIAVPTTAGTGSEVSLATVITDPEGQDKFPISDFCLIPDVAVLDEENTRTMTPFRTATTGMDAMTHAVEAYIGRSTTRETRADALEAVRLIFENIETVYRQTDDPEARGRMLEAAYLAGNAFSKSYVGYVHAIAHSLGGKYDLPHGLCCAVLMPYVLEAYGDVIHKKLHRLAVAAGVALESDRHDQAAAKFISAVKGLNGRMELPCGFSEIRAEDIPALAKHAAKEANPIYPVPVLMDGEELEQIYRRLMEK